MKKFSSNFNIRPNSIIFAAIAIPFCLFVLQTAALATETRKFERASNIIKTAKIFLEELTNAADNPAIEITLNNIDPRLKLRKCHNPISASTDETAEKRGRLTVIVTCDYPIAWKVLLSASIDEYGEVMVARKTITRKSVLMEQDIEKKRVKVSSLRKQPLVDKLQVIGSTSKRQLRAGSILFEDSVCLVCRGDHVKISAKSRYLNIDLEGIALADARIGDTTLVRNKQSKRSFSAKVIGKNHLEVSLSETAINE